jgi:hypothetical protein
MSDLMSFLKFFTPPTGMSNNSTNIETRRQILTRLKFIGNIAPHEKIDSRSLKIETNNLFTPLKRLLFTRDSRETSLYFFASTIDRSFEIIAAHINSNNISEQIFCNNIIQDLIHSIKGLKSTQITYAEDKLVVCELDVLIESISGKLFEIKNLFPELFVVKDYSIANMPSTPRLVAQNDLTNYNQLDTSLYNTLKKGADIIYSVANGADNQEESTLLQKEFNKKIRQDEYRQQLKTEELKIEKFKHEEKRLLEYEKTKHEEKRLLEYEKTKHEEKRLLEYEKTKHEEKRLLEYEKTKHEEKRLLEYEKTKHDKKQDNFAKEILDAQLKIKREKMETRREFDSNKAVDNHKDIENRWQNTPKQISPFILSNSVNPDIQTPLILSSSIHPISHSTVLQLLEDPDEMSNLHNI